MGLDPVLGLMGLGPSHQEVQDKKWIFEMDEEIGAIECNNTWE